MSAPTVVEIKAQIQAFFGDTSRSPAETREGLEEIVEDTEMLIDTLPEDDL